MAMEPLKPIFPPEEINYSAAAMQAAEEMLDEHTRTILETDRARLLQGTVVAAFTLGQAVDLSEGASQELQCALVSRLNEVSPAHHSYVNQLLGNVAMVLTDQRPSEAYREPVSIIPILHDVKTTGKAPIHVVTAFETAAPEATPAHSEPALPPENAAAQPQPTKEKDIEEPEAPKVDEIDAAQLFDPRDILKLPEGVKLFRHTRVPNFMRHFLLNVFKDHSETVQSLDPLAASLLMFETMHFYMTAKIPQASLKRKQAQQARIEALTGLYTTPVEVGVLMEILDISNPSLYEGLKTAKRNLYECIENPEEMIRKAAATAAHGNEDDIFTYKPQQLALENAGPQRESFTKGSGKRKPNRVDGDEPGADMKTEANVNPIETKADSLTGTLEKQLSKQQRRELLERAVTTPKPRTGTPARIS